MIECKAGKCVESLLDWRSASPAPAPSSLLVVVMVVVVPILLAVVPLFPCRGAWPQSRAC